ncbi:MAG: hypothetical protein Pg6C_05820 [Treponemataceae bacterium]|nr:MAG: hypothetical protein Pg6C_05820 [Treponemataceae bacterium]
MRAGMTRGKIHDYQTLCDAFLSSDAEEHETSRCIIWARSRLHHLLTFDPLTGKALPQGLDQIAAKVLETWENGETRDPVYRIAEYAKPALDALLQNIKDDVRRIHAVMPLHQARETDSATIRFLSPKPGQNIREKIAGARQRIAAVKRIMDIDLPENRLLKAFIARLTHLLETRIATYKPQADDLGHILHGRLKRWLQSDEAESIGEWKNLTPNNTLLQNKNYHKIWNAWRMLRELDQIIEDDVKDIWQNTLKINFLVILSWLSETGSVRFLQQPVDIDYDTFNINYVHTGTRIEGYYFPVQGKEKKLVCSLKQDLIEIEIERIKKQYRNLPDRRDILTLLEKFGAVRQRNARENRGLPVETDIAAIDTFSVQPNICFKPKDAGQFQNTRLPFRLLYQTWKTEHKTIVIDCAESKAILAAPPGGRSVSFLDMFREDDNNSNSDNGIFVRKIKEFLKTDRLVYLVPDDVSEFVLTNLRKNLNFYFQIAEPLPRSIARIFAWQNTQEFRNLADTKRIKEGDKIDVVDISGGAKCLTRLECVYAAGLPEQMRGICWKRHVPKSVENGQPSIREGLAKLFAADSEEVCRLFGQSGLCAERNSLSILVGDNRWIHVPPNIKAVLAGVGRPQNRTDAAMTLIIGDLGRPETEQLAEGAMILHQWQKLVPGIPLWQDTLPPLAIQGGIVDEWGFPTRFQLVSEHGSQLITPRLGDSFDIEIKEEFTLPPNVLEMRFPLAQGSGQKKLRHAALIRHSAFPLKEPVKGTMKLRYTFGADDPYKLEFRAAAPVSAGFKKIDIVWDDQNLTQSDFQIKIIIPEFNLPKNYDDIEENLKKITDRLKYLNYIDLNNIGNYTIVQKESERNEKKSTFWEYSSSNRQKPAPLYLHNIRRHVYAVWNNGIPMHEWPDEYKGYCEPIRSSIDLAKSFVMNEEYEKYIPESLRDELLHFLCCLQDDTPDEIGERLSVIEDQRLTDFKNDIPYAIGSGGKTWQKKIISNLCDTIKEKKSYFLTDTCCQILAVALWRSESLIYSIDKEIIPDIFEYIEGVFTNNSNLLKRQGDARWDPKKVSRSAELLLALLRIHKNDDTAFSGYHAQLKLEKISQLIGNLIKNIFKSNTTGELRTRLMLKFDEDQIPAGYKKRKDLLILYWLYLCITGDSGSGKIKFNGTIEE